MDMSLSELWELVMDSEPWRAAIHGITKSRTRLSDWTELNWYNEVNQLYVYVWYIYPLPLEPSYHPASVLPLSVITECQADLPANTFY